MGYYEDASGHGHGFLEFGGSFTTIDVPGASDTEALGINNAGQVVGSGYYGDAGDHGFLESAGSFTTIDVPGASDTEAYGINDAGQVVGYYYEDASGQSHGFLLVLQAGTTTALVGGPSPSVYGQMVTFTATVSPVAPGGGTPTGSVEFMDGSTTLGSAALSSGVATFSTTSLSVATHSITAVYGGDGNFTTSTSSAVSQTVNQASTTTSLTSSVNPSVFGQSVTFTATVTANGPGSGTPTGTVTFMDGTTALNPGGTTLDDSGTATFTTTTLAAGDHPAITAVYGGDTNFSGSTSAAIDQFVGPDLAATSLTWASDGGVDFGYSISGADLPQATTVDLDWASGTTVNTVIGSPIISTTTATAQGTYQLHATPSQLGTPPPGAKDLLVVVDPNNTVSPADSSKVASLALPDIAATSLTWDATQGGVDYGYTISNANLPQPTTAALYWAPTATFDSTQDTLIPGSVFTTATAA